MSDLEVFQEVEFNIVEKQLAPLLSIDEGIIDHTEINPNHSQEVIEQRQGDLIIQLLNDKASLISDALIRSGFVKCGVIDNKVYASLKFELQKPTTLEKMTSRIKLALSYFFC